MYEKDQPMKIAELGDTIFIAESSKTPFTRLIKTGPAPKQMAASWPAQAWPKRGFGGTLDGTDKSSWSKTTREEIEAYAMWFMSDGWLASKLANLTATAGVGKKEKAKQMTDDGLLFALQIEKQFLSSYDTAKEAAPTTAFRSRGAFSWLSAAAQTVKPVPSDLRPVAACNYAGTLANFTSAQVKTMMEAAATQISQPVDLTGFVGIKLKQKMSDYAQHDTDVASETALQRFSMDVKEKAFMHIVDFFSFDSGNIKTVTNWNLYAEEATGEANDETTRSGIFVALSMWQKRWLQAPMAFIEPPKSGGPRGYHDAVGILACDNPQGQMRAIISS